MSRAKDAEIASVQVQGPSYSPYFYFQDEDTEHGGLVSRCRHVSQSIARGTRQEGGRVCSLSARQRSTGNPDALSVAHDFKLDDQARQALELIKSTDTITDVGDGEVVTVDEDRTDGNRKLSLDADGYLTANYVKFAEFPTLYHQGAGGEHQVAITFDDGPDPDDAENFGPSQSSKCKGHVFRCRKQRRTLPSACSSHRQRRT